MNERHLLVIGVSDSRLTSTQRQLLASHQLTDCGDHVEWSDGRAVLSWRLRDQVGADTALPILESVVRIQSRSAMIPSTRFATARTIYCAADGGYLADATPKPFWSLELSERCYPRDVFHLLESRGVRFATEEPITVERLEKAHPGIGGSGVLAFYRRHAFLVIVGILAVAVAIAEVVTFTIA